MVKVYNTLSRRKETLKPLRDKNLKLFVCGPTVYDFSHIGHARTYIAFDAFAKYLKSVGFDVFYLQNITDVDDKIINRAKELGQSPQLIARNFEREYFKDMKALGVNSVKKYARATDHIKEIIKQVQILLQKGYAYLAKDGVYYDIQKFKEYGKLSRRTTEQANDAVSRIDESVEKKNKGDFALWKFSKEDEPSWQFQGELSSPRGELSSPWIQAGRPGWHIEDTAITEKYFSSQYDIHGGAQDLIFPHHEAEIAQMEAISGKKPLARYWMHTGFLTINGQKMSKSLGNFITIRDFLKSYSPRLLRLFVLKTHYRSPIDYSGESLDQTKQELKRIDEFVEKLRKGCSLKRKTQKDFKLQVSYFKEAMEDDFNTPKAIAAIFELVRQGNISLEKGTMSAKIKEEIIEFLKEADAIFGFIFGSKKREEIPREVAQLVKTREEYRKQQNWQRADELRREISQKGWSISDTQKGPLLKRIRS